MPEREISKDRLENYFDKTSRALEIVKENVVEGKKKEAEEIISMVDNYLSDARHFETLGEWVNAFAALNYAHGWLDSGVRLGIFDVDDRDLFTIR